ncbi:MAG: cytochrome c [Burkholderiales bacterium]|nr:cytochrome c [Burkholderiales bacterium]
MKKVLLGAAVVGALVSAGAQAQVPADRSIKYRQGGFQIMAIHFGRINAHIKGERNLTPAQLEMNAQVVDTMAKVVFEGFVEGTDQSANTKAKPEIWKEFAKFKDGGAKLSAETAKLVAAAKTGDKAQLQAAFGGVGGACKACHDVYRNN